MKITIYSWTRDRIPVTCAIAWLIRPGLNPQTELSHCRLPARTSVASSAASGKRPPPLFTTPHRNPPLPAISVNLDAVHQFVGLEISNSVNIVRPCFARVIGGQRVFSVHKGTKRRRFFCCRCFFFCWLCGREASVWASSLPRDPGP